MDRSFVGRQRCFLGWSFGRRPCLSFGTGLWGLEVPICQTRTVPTSLLGLQELETSQGLVGARKVDLARIVRSTVYTTAFFRRLHGHNAYRCSSLDFDFFLASLVREKGFDESSFFFQDLPERFHIGRCGCQTVERLSCSFVQVILDIAKYSIDSLLRFASVDRDLLSIISPHYCHLFRLDIFGSNLNTERDPFHFPFVIFPTRGVLGSIVDQCSYPDLFQLR